MRNVVDLHADVVLPLVMELIVLVDTQWLSCPLWRQGLQLKRLYSYLLKVEFYL